MCCPFIETEEEHEQEPITWYRKKLLSDYSYLAPSAGGFIDGLVNYLVIVVRRVATSNNNHNRMVHQYQ